MLLLRGRRRLHAELVISLFFLPDIHPQLIINDKQMNLLHLIQRYMKKSFGEIMTKNLPPLPVGGRDLKIFAGPPLRECLLASMIRGKTFKIMRRSKD